jgi:preprotein translocase subunit SecF
MFFRRLNWNVVGWFRIVSAISYLVIGLGIAMMIYNYVTTGAPLRLGLSFTGGTDITLHFASPTTKDAIAAAMPTAGITDAKINSIGPKPGEPAGERWTIETQKDFGNDTAPLYAAIAKIGPVYQAPGTKPPLPKLGTDGAISTVGPSLSHEYLLNAIKALVIAIAIQFLYIAFRFGWNLIFGWVIVVALVRDSLMMIGIYAIAGRRVDDAFLAAVLTVIGYSVMDTIVILDRIRENVKLMDGRPFDEIVNTSILQTMTRSVNTLATVVITLVALLALGGPSLKNFAFALLVGIVSGGYHSIFFSAPLVAVLQKRAKSRRIFRGSSLEQPKTVAQARAQNSAAAQRDREEIAALRRARRDRERDGATRRTSQPPRYKRQRSDETDFEKLENRNFGVPERPKSQPNEPVAEADHEGFDYEHDREIVDPLDAQAMGLHDEANALGHETINLNLGDDEHGVTTPGAPPEPKPNP